MPRTNNSRTARTSLGLDTLDGRVMPTVTGVTSIIDINQAGGPPGETHHLIVRTLSPPTAHYAERL